MLIFNKDTRWVHTIHFLLQIYHAAVMGATFVGVTAAMVGADAVVAAAAVVTATVVAAAEIENKVIIYHTLIQACI